jgi:hypothetical protein
MIDFKTRPLSWSAISSFEYDPEQWYSKYILNEKQEESKEMAWGKKLSKSIEDGKPLVPFIIYPVVEKKLSVMFSGIPLIGYIDTFDPETYFFREYKSSRTIWSRKKAESHGQLAFYALLIFITYKVPPEKYSIHLDCVQTRENGEFEMEFVQPVKVVSYRVKLTMKDVLAMGLRIKRTVKEMEEFVLAKSTASTIMK